MRIERPVVGVATGVLLTLLNRNAGADELTAQAAAERAVRTSHEVLGSQSSREAARARERQAKFAFLPRLNASARYTRLSDFDPPPLFPFSVAATNDPAGTVAPGTASSGRISLTPIVDNYVLEATLSVPLSDYVLRLARNLEAAKRGRESAELETVVADSRARLSGKLAFFEWMRSGASVDAARQTVAEQRLHLTDVSNQVAQGTASRADALRVDSAVASAEAMLAEADAQRATAEQRLRTTLRLDSSALSTPETLDVAIAPFVPDEGVWLAEAYRDRAELRALGASESAARAQASAARSAYVPTLGAFASATYANPNQRYFPPDATWHATWALGAVITWTPTDIPGAEAGASEADARGDGLAAQQRALRDAITVEIVQSYQLARAADVKVVATDRQLASAAEAYRVTRSLFFNARATTSNVLDAETDLALARLAWVNARIDARVTRARLSYAAGHEQRGPTPVSGVGPERGKD